MKKISGAITAIATPFKKEGEIDVSALQNFIKFQLKEGIDGIVPCGSTGEAATLTPEDYQLVVKTVVNEVKGKVPVIAGAGSNDTAKAVNFSKLAKEAGVDALLHVTPFYNKPTLNGLIAHYKEIARETDMPIILYNVPGRTGLNSTASMTLEVARKVPQVIGVKEASGDLNQMMDIIRGSSDSFNVLSGDDSNALPLLSVGGNGCISVVANEVPKKFSQLIRFGLEGNINQAKKLHYDLLDLMNINFIETNPLPVKTALNMMGLFEEVFRLPLVPMKKENKVVLKKVLKETNLI